MANPSSREELKQWCLRKLGQPTIKVNVADSQLEDRIDEALQYFAEYHYDGIEKVFNKHVVTADDIANEYLAIEDDIISVSNVLPLSEDGLSSNIFDVRYQARLSDVHYFSSTFLQYYDQTKRHINLVNQILSPAQSIRFNRHMDKIYVDSIEWGVDIVEGQYIIIEGYRQLDPEIYTDIYNDRFLKQYITSLFKMQWGQNLSKYDGIQLPGGVTMNGQKMYDQANDELQSIREKMQLENEEPVDFFLG